MQAAMERTMEVNGLPPGFRFINSKLQCRNITIFQISVLFITFFAYASFHASRKPPSIVKSVIGPKIRENEVENSQLGINTSTNLGNHTSSVGGWAPFNGDHGIHRLGELDVAFLSVYSLGMYFAGHAGDRINLRVFLTFGMFGSGLFTVLFGMGYWWGVHSFAYFLVVQMISGVFQSIGWPSVVAIVGNWFGKSKRGFIMGVWNSHTSAGNIIGSFVAAWALEYGWGWSFAIPGIAIALMGVVVYLFLVVNPEDAGFKSPSQDLELLSSVQYDRITEKDKLAIVTEESMSDTRNLGSEDSEKAIQPKEGDDESLLCVSEVRGSKAIGFIDAWMIPGVVPYAFCLFFSKLVAYTFLYWLPFYLRHTAVSGSFLSHKMAGLLSTLFDVGGILGGILAGYISDKLEAHAITSIAFLFVSIPTLVLYRLYGSISMSSNIILMFLCGLFVNGPYALITTAVAADIGTTTGNSQALATVTAIIDGTGSVGAALGPLLTGYISSKGWNGVFFMLILATSLAALLLVQLARAEFRKMQQNTPCKSL